MSQVSWRAVLWGLGLQFVFGILVIRTDFGFNAFQWLGNQIQVWETECEGSCFRPPEKGDLGEAWGDWAVSCNDGGGMSRGKVNCMLGFGVLSPLSFSDLVGHSLPPCCQEANGSVSVSTRSSSCMRLIPSSWLYSCLLSLFSSRFSWTTLWLAPVLYLGICWSRVPLPFRLYLLYRQEWGSLWGRYKAEGEDVCLRDQLVYIPIRP